jgi:hypothetical protein
VAFFVAPEFDSRDFSSRCAHITETELRTSQTRQTGGGPASGLISCRTRQVSRSTHSVAFARHRAGRAFSGCRIACVPDGEVAAGVKGNFE